MFYRIYRDQGGLPGEEGKRGEPSRNRERYFVTSIVSYWSIRGEGECRGISEDVLPQQKRPDCAMDWEQSSSG